MPKMNKKIIKEQNLAAKGGKYITKNEALVRIAKREEDEKLEALKGRR